MVSKYKKKWQDSKEPLKSDKETIGELIEKYGKIVSIFGAGEAAESIGKALSNVDIETLKKGLKSYLLIVRKNLLCLLMILTDLISRRYIQYLDLLN